LCEREGGGEQALITWTFPEMELVLDEEEPQPEKTEAERVAAFEAASERLGVTDTSHDKSIDELEQDMASVIKADKMLLAFRERISAEPSQVLRYSRVSARRSWAHGGPGMHIRTLAPPVTCT